jgi:hypothetical protein
LGGLPKLTAGFARDVGPVSLSTSDDSGSAATFIARWQESAAAERANYQLFLSELCDLLAVPRPNPTRPNDADNAYVFERAVSFRYADGSTSPGRIDLYKRGCFVLEAKQGSGQERAEQLRLFDATPRKAKKGTAVRGTPAWDDAMVRARGQAEAYAKALPDEEGWPPFLIVVDVGHCIELYADFARTGKAYTQFPDASSFRTPLPIWRATRSASVCARSGPIRFRSTPPARAPASRARLPIALAGSPSR